MHEDLKDIIQSINRVLRIQAERTEVILLQQQRIIEQQEQLMGQLEDAQAALSKIDAATTKQSASLASLAGVAQEINDDIDRLMATPNIPPEISASLTNLADRSQAVSDSLDAHVEFSKSVAAKSNPPTNPVPVPVPEPLPEA